MKLKFLGAAQTVTGSKYLLSIGASQILVDCGLFQGFKALRLKNWLPVPVNGAKAIVLTHAHLDHSGALPILARNGFSGPVYCTPATLDLCRILLPDAGYLQEEEARFANKHQFSKHRPALPLFTQKDAEAALKLLRPVDFRRQTPLPGGGTFEFVAAGHLLGAASARIEASGRSILFSGDLGRAQDLIMSPPERPPGADYVVIESTYGDRVHEHAEAEPVLAAAINRTLQRGGTILIPSFAVGRAQVILYLIWRLKQKRLIPEVPVYLNSPMAANANEVFKKYAGTHKLSTDEAAQVCAVAKVIRDVEDSIRINESKTPKILIAASGMATGGRVLHHLKNLAPDPKNTLIFTGFQAGGTRGEAIVHGAREVKIHGEYWPIRAEVLNLDLLSAHADRDELLAWLGELSPRPKRVFVTHGEASAADALRHKIEESLKLEALAPEGMQEVEL